MRGRFRESELVEAPPHQAEIWFSSVPCGPLPASGYRIHTSRKATQIQWVSRCPLCEERRSEHFSYLVEMTRISFAGELAQRIKSVHTIAACGERATRYGGKLKFGSVRGRFRTLRLAERPPHPSFSPRSGEKE